MSSLAQEESRSISENVTWGQRKRFADGKVSMAYKHFLGYRKGPDGQPEIDPKEAETVRNIYRWFMEGQTYCAIASRLTGNGVLTPGGKQKWQPNTVKSILTNEKYMGAALLQKSFTVDFLQKKMKPNEGEVPQYYVAESHPATIDPVEWRKVQAEITRRAQYDHKSACASPFSGKIICGDCGAVYGSKVWHSRNQYRRVIWQCNSKYEGEQKCSSPHLTEDQIKGAFARAIGQLLTDRARIIEDLEAVKQGLCEETDLIEKQKNLLAEMEVLENLMHKAVMENAETAQDQEEYSKRYEAYAAKHEKLKKQYGDAQAEREARQNKAQILEGMAGVQIAQLPGDLRNALIRLTQHLFTELHFLPIRVVYKIFSYITAEHAGKITGAQVAQLRHSLHRDHLSQVIAYIYHGWIHHTAFGNYALIGLRAV